MRFIILFLLLANSLPAQSIYFRLNQVGYHLQDTKKAILLSKAPLEAQVNLIELPNQNVLEKLNLSPTNGSKWGAFPYQYLVDFSDLKTKGEFQLQLGDDYSAIFKIHQQPFQIYEADLLAFMRQQRCGYNPYYDEVCHQGDGRLFYAPVPDSTFQDFSGGWHDAGDQLKYLITSSNATARMLLAYELAGAHFKDQVDAYGQARANQIPDILDEARWGLEWLLKLHPQPDWLIHQIADDRDHRGFKYPHLDHSEYGWGPNSYRAAYFATGTPQGLGKWKSKATGVANVAGRSAAALAIGARVWEKLDPSFSLKCQTAAFELYDLGKSKEGYQQGNSYGAPYRYNENSWADDMEWAAAELYKLTQQKSYLKEAIRYANLIQDDGWMARDTMSHYEKYPFMNMGHFALYPSAPRAIKKQLASWYQANIEKVLERSKSNTYQMGVPFIWCSNNLVVNFITQVNLYEEMTGDLQYHELMLLHRDWLFGRNPWGTSMFTGIPRKGETPLDVHIPPRALLQETPPGGLIDGPVYRTIFEQLKGLTLTEADEMAPFQNNFVVYHDDIGDYSTNEPTMDGTADAILMFALWNRELKLQSR